MGDVQRPSRCGEAAGHPGPRPPQHCSTAAPASPAPRASPSCLQDIGCDGAKSAAARPPVDEHLSIQAAAGGQAPVGRWARGGEVGYGTVHQCRERKPMRGTAPTGLEGIHASRAPASTAALPPCLRWLLARRLRQQPLPLPARLLKPLAHPASALSRLVLPDPASARQQTVGGLACWLNRRCHSEAATGLPLPRPAPCARITRPGRQPAKQEPAAPVGPMMANRWLDSTCPLMSCRIVFCLRLRRRPTVTL